MEHRVVGTSLERRPEALNRAVIVATPVKSPRQVVASRVKLLGNPVGSGPSSIAVDPQTNFIYVANAGNYDFNQHGSVSVINGATKATNTLTDPNLTYPFRIAVNPTTNKIYVASLLSNNVTVIDGAR